MTTLNRSGRWWAAGILAVFLLLSLVNIAGNNLAPRIRSSTVASSQPAKRLSVEELFSRPLSQDVTAVPRLFHQSWSSNELPSRFQYWSQTCRDKHPEWEWVLWTDEDNLTLCKKYFPWFLNTFQALAGPILRADVARAMYMYIFGGVYADLDTECLLNSEELFASYNLSSVSHPATMPSQSGNRTAIFGRMGTDTSFADSIPNAWMASSPGHPFHLMLLEEVDSRMTKGYASEFGVEALTGPGALYDELALYQDLYSAPTNQSALDRHFADNPTTKSRTPYGTLAGYSPHHRVELLPFYSIYPYSWHRDGEGVREICEVTHSHFNATKCKLLLGVAEWPSYTITYWSHTWTAEGHNDGNLQGLDD